MIKRNSIPVFLFIVFAFAVKAQDKLFLKNGSAVHCKILAISENTITYRDTIITAPQVTIPKAEVLLAEYKGGQVYIFGQAVNTYTAAPQTEETREQRKERRLKEWKLKEQELSNNILGFYIPELLLGRFTVSYERLLAGKSLGVKVPFSLTYNPLIALNSLASSSSTTSSSGSSSGNNNNNQTYDPPRGTGFITGLDINYYHDLKPELKYFFGPRIRYGTDMMLGAIEGLTVQVQNGIFKSSGKRMTSTVAIGFGFFKLSQKYANYPGYEPKQVYPWASFTWRLGFRL